jgi:hypothetical protein
VVGGSRVHRGGPGRPGIGRTPAALEPYVSASGLAMRAAAVLATQNQDARRLPPMARGETLGDFAPTEPDHASDSVPRGIGATRIAFPPGGLGRPAAADPA